MCKYGVAFERSGAVHVDGSTAEIEPVDMTEVHRFGDVETVGKPGVVSTRERHDKLPRLLHRVHDLDAMIYQYSRWDDRDDLM